MNNTFASSLHYIEGRPSLAALALGVVFFVSHFLNLWIYDSCRIASSYLVAYVIARDVLLSINNSEWFSSTAFVLIVFLFFYSIVRVLKQRQSLLKVTLMVLIGILVLLSIPLFPEGAFHK